MKTTSAAYIMENDQESRRLELKTDVREIGRAHV